jgi:hypothetical protein
MKQLITKIKNAPSKIGGALGLNTRARKVALTKHNTEALKREDAHDIRFNPKLKKHALSPRERISIASSHADAGRKLDMPPPPGAKASSNPSKTKAAAIVATTK